jgi:uncharacterized protein with HEPN domain
MPSTRSRITAERDMRLWLDHEYHRVDATVVGRTVTQHLPELRSAIATELDR